MVQAYPDPVRVVSVGKAVDALLADPDNKENAANSVEFCGGTHLSNTSDAVDFAIVSESAIAQGAPAPHIPLDMGSCPAVLHRACSGRPC